jgi:hypothetical protein
MMIPDIPEAGSLQYRYALQEVQERTRSHKNVAIDLPWLPEPLTHLVTWVSRAHLDRRGASS